MDLPQKLVRPEQEIFDDLKKLCGEPGYVHVLAFFNYRDNFVTYKDEMTADAMASSYAPTRLIRTEMSTLIGLMVQSQLSFELPSPDRFQALIERTNTLLAELHDALNAPMLAIFSNEKLRGHVDPFSSAKVLREPIFYGGESAYSFQYRDFSVQRYSRDNAWLKGNRGFTIDEAHQVVDAIRKINDEKVLARLREMRAMGLGELAILPGYIFRAQEVVERTGLAAGSVAAVLAAFTLPKTPTNANFVSLGDFNAANATPLILTPRGEYLLLQTYSLLEALYDSPYYWMMSDPKYRNTSTKNRGLFTEELTADRLKTVFGEESVHSNVDIICGKGATIGEIDVLVVFGDRMIIAQCKSKKLTLEARRGNDLQLQSDFKAAVQDAYDQGLTCAKAIQNGAVTLKASGGDSLSYNPPSEIYILCIVSDNYPALTVQGRQFLKSESDRIIQTPLVCDVFFIDVLVEMLSTPLRLLSYINRRSNYNDRISAVNEITVLGYHLSVNLWLSPELQMAILTDDVALNLDVAMTVRREGIPGPRTPPGILTRLRKNTAVKLLNGIERAKSPGLIDLGFLLLSISEDALRALGSSIDQIIRQTRKDGGLHDATLSFDRASGITIHCSREPNASAAQALLEHCRKRKYVQKADSWFGLSVREDDGMPKFGISTREPWVPDPKLDDAVKGMSRTSNAVFSGGQAKKRKIGPNERCPCGSGLKNKKCCRR